MGEPRPPSLDSNIGLHLSPGKKEEPCKTWPLSQTLECFRSLSQSHIGSETLSHTCIVSQTLSQTHPEIL